jgi:hypothetical protein
MCRKLLPRAVALATLLTLGTFWADWNLPRRSRLGTSLSARCFTRASRCGDRRDEEDFTATQPRAPGR